MDKLPPEKKAEIDRFKRHLIQSVACLLIQQKKPEEEIWEQLKRETGCNCKLMWERMRAVTMKKLDRLFLANDNIDALAVRCRMSVIDWLMFDQVIVHQNTDLIGQEKFKDYNDDHPLLVELFELVKLYNIEHLSRNYLPDAWARATLYYNERGHRCTPMLLQGRWYQLRKVTRDKFYNFWYSHRGNITRLRYDQKFRPTPLQVDIASTFKTLVINRFNEWDVMIERRLVTMPEEFEQMVNETAARTNPAKWKPCEDVPDLVIIEPIIETIDLTLEPDDNATEQNKQEEEGFPVPPLARIKQERDYMEVETPLKPPKKSMFKVVLESTALESLRFNNMDTEVHNHGNNDTKHVEKTNEEDENKSVMPRIGSVFGNLTDTSVIANIDEDQTNANIENTGDVGNVSGTSAVNAKDTINYNDFNTCEISDDDYDVSSNVLGRINETSVVGNISGNLDKAGVFSSARATNVIGSVYVTGTVSSGDETNITCNIKDGMQPVTKENMPNNVLNAQICNSLVNKTAKVIKDVEITDNSC